MNVKELVGTKAHLVKCRQDKSACERGWQKTPWDGSGDAALVGMVPGSLNYAVCDVDIPHDLDESEREAERDRRAAQVRALLGPERFVVETPSGGLHLWYRVAEGGVVRNGAYEWGDVRGDRGYVILWDAERLMEDVLVFDKATHTRKEFTEALRVTAGPRPVGVPGRRNTDLYNRVVAAVANDGDPETAIRRAVQQAQAQGLPGHEIQATVESGRKAGAEAKDVDFVPDELKHAMRLMEANEVAALEFLREYGKSEEWSALERDRKGLVVSWMRGTCPAAWRSTVISQLGSLAQDGRWLSPRPVPEEPFIDVPGRLDDEQWEQPEVVAHGLAFRGKVGLLHGPAGHGKTTLVANMATRVTDGRAFAGRPTVAGEVLLVAEDLDTWRHVFHENGGDPKKVRTTGWPIRRSHVLEDVVLVVVDTMAYVSNIEGINLDKAHEVDRVLRPLSELAAEFNVAVLVLDHEPWSNEQGKQGKTAERPRHSGAKVGTCDWLARVEMDRDRGGVKVTRGLKSRVGIEIPAEIWYDARGDAIDGADLPAADPEANDWALEYLTPVAATVSELIRRKGETPNGALSKKLRDALTALADEDGLVQRVAKDGLKPEGVKGNPWMYYVKEE